jgi:hypothetical protein
MSEHFPVIYVARHGETPWSLTGQHTGLTDLPLTPKGERNARRLGDRLKGLTMAKVFTSPLQRAFRTCELAGFGATAESDPDLVEWDYGQHEGLRPAEILRERPDWQLFWDGLPGRRIARTNRRAGGPCGRACSRSSGQRPPLFQRAFHSGSGSPLAGAQSGICGQVFCIEPGEPERAKL